MHDMFSVIVGKYHLLCHPQTAPSIWDFHLERAKLAEQINDSYNEDAQTCYLSVWEETRGLLVLALTFQPAGGVYPGILIVPETDLLFLGAGETLLAYDLTV